jgi:hypothetical protein
MASVDFRWCRDGDEKQQGWNLTQFALDDAISPALNSPSRATNTPVMCQNSPSVYSYSLLHWYKNYQYPCGAKTSCLRARAPECPEHQQNKCFQTIVVTAARQAVGIRLPATPPSVQSIAKAPKKKGTKGARTHALVAASIRKNHSASSGQKLLHVYGGPGSNILRRPRPLRTFCGLGLDSPSPPTHAQKHPDETLATSFSEEGFELSTDWHKQPNLVSAAVAV